MVNLHHGSISGRHYPGKKILLLKLNSYANASGWDDLVHVFTESLNHSPLDEMTLLVRTGIPGQYEQRPKYVSLASYERLDEVPKLLSLDPSALGSGTTPARKQRPYIEVVTRVQSNRNHDGEGHIEINEARDPLQCVLEWLDMIKTFAESEKKEAKKRRMVTEDKKNYQELTEALTQHRCDSIYCTLQQGPNKPFSKLLKKTIALRKKLYPSSPGSHEERSVIDLRHEILEVKAILESTDHIPGSMEPRDRIKKRWDEGCKWIVEKQG